MKRIWMLMGLALAAGAVRAQETVYPGDAAIARAEAKARAASVPCEKELNAGSSGAACGRYHEAVLAAMAAENRRQTWCNARNSEATNVQIPASCYGATVGDMRLDAVMGLERRKAPKAWKAFDNQMANLAR